MDKHHPQYHFMPPANWMNDPNGLIQWQGTYHLFYQHNPDAATWGPMHWGHAISPDLVHWQHLPIALAPTPGGPDDSGVWSGCAVDWNGVPTVVYTGRDNTSANPEHVCLAFSHDDLRTWEKYAGNPVIVGSPPGLEQVGFRDPCVWQENGIWLMALGTGIYEVGGAILLYSSANLTDWTYLGPLIVGDSKQKGPVWTGDMWECPNFFPLGDRHVLMVSPMGLLPSRSLYTIYFVGEFRDYRFTPEMYAKMDGGDVYFYAPQAFLDESGRRIALGWSREARSSEAQVAAGWAGVMTLPRLLEWRADGWMSQRPIPELETLRGENRSWTNLALQGAPQLLEGFSGDTLELDIHFDLGAHSAPGVLSAPGALNAPGAFGLMVRRSPGGEEQTEIRLDQMNGRLVVDTRKSSLDPTVETGVYEIPLDFSGLDPLHLRVFLDRSIIEVYANDLAVITARVYPSRADSLGIALFASSEADSLVRIERLDAWQMNSF